jgi:soluble lytic murein transglycosylase
MGERTQERSPRGRVLTTTWLLLAMTLVLSLVVASCSESLPIPAPQPTATPTMLPSATPTSVVSPTASLAPTFTPTPILAAGEALQAGQQQQRDGDYEAAAGVYQAIVSSFPDSPEARDALYHLAEVYALEHNYSGAVEALLRFREQYPEDERCAFATFRLATAYEGLGEWDEAIAAYREYGDQRTIISDYVHLNIGYALMELERYEEARGEFAQVLDLAPPLTLEQQALRNMALASRHVDEYDQAIAFYGQLLDKTEEEASRAETLYQMAVTYQEAEDQDQAVQVFTQLAKEYPRTYQAYQALEELDALEVTAVNSFERGLIYYYNGLYDPAVLAFYDYIKKVEDTAEAHYYAGLAYRGYDAHYLSIDEFQTIIDDHADSDLVGEAWLEMARSWVLIGNNDSAIATYQQFFSSLPQDPLADDAQWKLANLLEDDGEWEQAIAAYMGLAERFPAGEYAPQALFRAGLAHYRLGQYDEAQQVWQTVLGQYAESETQSQALFWLGKTALGLGEVEDGVSYLQELTASDAGAYYGLRAADLLRGGPSENPPDIYALDLYQMGDEAERLDFEAWLSGWAGDSGGQPSGELSARVANDQLFQRGLELLRVGEWDSAKARFREVRTRFQDDPVALYSLAIFFQQEGFYDQSIACAQRILKLSPQSSAYDAPVFLQKLLYPAYFADLIVPEAEKRGLDPLLFLALVWQESKFDPYATSASPARGLTQFIDSTSTWVAEQLGLTDFDTSDMYRPVVSAEFGGWYLEWILDYEHGSMFRALAHYNAGPGAVARWSRDGEVTEDDLFVEEVDYSETRSFITWIYGYYWAYRNAYYGSL